MSFWQCPACVRDSYFCGMTHLKLHLMSEHNISGRTLTRIIEGLTPAFESDADLNKEVSVSEEKILSESKMKNESEMKREEVH